MKSTYFIIISILLLAICRPTPVAAEPITGPAFDSLLSAQNLPLQRLLDSLYSEDSGYITAGPLDCRFQGDSISYCLFRSLRVICPSIGSLEYAFSNLKKCSTITIDRWISHIHMARQETPLGYRGILAVVVFQGKTAYVQFNTIQETRWLIWAHDALRQDSARTISPDQWAGYARAMSEYLYAVDQNWPDNTSPKAGSFGLPDTMDFFPPLPEPAITPYQNYLNLFAPHTAITTDFARGINAFYPADSLLKALKTNAPAVAYPNKNSRSFQLEFANFISRGGDLREIKTLTKRVFDSLAAGEYVYAVSLSGKIRITREPAPGEIERYERMKAHKMPLIAESFLFPGEPVLVAGKLVVGRDSVSYIAEVNVRSSHYFQSLFSPAITSEIAEKSNDYLLSLGHFFRALEQAGIGNRPVLIRKF